MSQMGNSVEMEIIVVLRENKGWWDRSVRHPDIIGSLEADKVPVEMTMLNK